MQLEIIDPDPQSDTSLFKSIAETVFAGEHIDADYLNVIFMKQDQLRLMKKEYFGKDVYTDVITFNLNLPTEPLEGEIYLSFEQITLNAEKYKTELQNELHRVLVHACLHLCGYEDTSEKLKAAMTALEDHYLAMIDTGKS